MCFPGILYLTEYLPNLRSGPICMRVDIERWDKLWNCTGRPATPFLRHWGSCIPSCFDCLFDVVNVVYQGVGGFLILERARTAEGVLVGEVSER
jgi:hypothetical protein